MPGSTPLETARACVERGHRAAITGDYASALREFEAGLSDLRAYLGPRSPEVLELEEDIAATYEMAGVAGLVRDLSPARSGLRVSPDGTFERLADDDILD